MRGRGGIVACVLGAMAGSAAAAETPWHACGLLTGDEIRAAAGAPAGEPHESAVPLTGAAKGETMGLCMWRIGDRGMATVAMMRQIDDPAQRKAGMAKMREAFDKLKEQGWTEEARQVGAAHCSMITPPAGKQDVPHMTGCFGEAAGMAMSVGVMTQRDVAIDAVKTLYDRAAGRLP